MQMPASVDPNCSRACPKCGERGYVGKFKFYDRGYMHICRCRCGWESPWVNTQGAPSGRPHPTFAARVEVDKKEKEKEIRKAAWEINRMKPWGMYETP
jgi:hypothetical protein